MMLEHFVLMLRLIEFEVAQGHLGRLQPLILKMLHLRIVLHIVEILEYLLVQGTLLLPFGCVMFPEYVL